MKIIKFSCPACGHGMEARKTMVNNWTECPACAQKFIVPNRNKNTRWYFIILAVALLIVGVIAYLRTMHTYDMLNH